MLNANDDVAVVQTRQPEPYSIQFFAIELSPTADGRFFVGIGATICEQEGELSQMELGYHRVATLEDAIEAIRQTVTNVH